MPHLHNGIGTWYIGKNNLKQTDGKCGFCGSWGKLSSYETRLWILVIFVPVVPLGKKQILDECPRCRRHRYMPLAKWKEIEADALRKAMQQADANPDDPQSMLQLHGTMIGFHRTPEALQLAEVMQADFPDNFDVQMHLGSWHATEGRADKARPYFRRALELEPENLVAKRMVALDSIDAGDLPRARELLRGMDAPGPNQAPSAMLALADAYQSRGDHADALEIYRTVLQMAPAYAQDTSLRKRIRGAETALGLTETALPKLRRKLGKWYVLAALLAAVVVGGLAYNFYQARNQPLHIVNGLSRPVVASIDGGAKIEVPARTRREIAVAEGVHRAVVQQAEEPDETIEFRVENGFFERFAGRSAFVLNPGGAAVILWKEVHYYPKNHPPANPGIPPYQIHFGKKWMEFRDIDYSFTKQPAEIQMKEHAQMESKTMLSVFNEEPQAILSLFPANAPAGELADFIESQLKQHREDPTLLEEYVQFRAPDNQLDRCREFLARGLAKKPIAIEWHRLYQQVCKMMGRQSEVEAEYHKKLDADPHNSALLYLFGRVASEPKQKKRYFRQAMEADPQNAYAKYGLAYDYALSGDFSKAKPLAQDACRIKPDHWDMEWLLFDVRFALKDYAALERELQDNLAANPYGIYTVKRLMQVQVALGAVDRAKATQSDYAQRFEQAPLLASNTSIGTQAALQSKLALLYLEGDQRGILNECPDFLNPAEAAGETFAAQLELGDLAAVETALPMSQDGKVSEDTALLLFLAWSRKGDKEKADEWRKKAVEILWASGEENRRIAPLLESGKAGLDDLDDMAMSISQKAILLVALADVGEEHRKGFLDLAEKLNTDTYFPHRFLKRTIEEMK
jgi:tetratricopeptide (TPR) repeat protein